MQSGEESFTRHLDEASAGESQAESAGQTKRAKMNEKSGKESDESRAKKEGGSGESEQGDGEGVTNEREAQVKMLLGALDAALCVQSIGRRSPRFQPRTPTSIKATGINRFIPRHDEVASKLGSDFWDFPRFAGESKFVEALSAVALLPAPGPDEADPLLLVLKQIAKVLSFTKLWSTRMIVPQRISSHTKGCRGMHTSRYLHQIAGKIHHDATQQRSAPRSA
jgi:hypothetical protein